MERQELGLLSACYLMQFLAEGSEMSGAFPAGWNTVGKVAEILWIPRPAATRIFEKWQARGWLDSRSLDIYRCQLTQAGHIEAQTQFFYRQLKMK